MPTSGGGNDGGSGTTPIAAPAPAPESDRVGDDSSSTNIQEAGVDEPDIVKSDGTNVFALTEGKLTAVDARSPTPRRLSSVTIRGFGAEMLAQGRRILVTSSSGSGTLLTEVDIANPAKMRVLRELSVDGSHVSSRLHGHTVRIVVASTPRAIEVPTPRPVTDGPTVIADTAKRKPLRARRAGWVPSSLLRNRRSGHKRRRALVACDDVRRTPRFTGAGMLSVLTIDLSYGLHAFDSDAVMTDASTVYASTGSVYVATAGGWERGDTSIHRFDVNGAAAHGLPRERGGPGRSAQPVLALRAQGHAARGHHLDASNESQSYVTVLATKGGRLEKAGQVGGLGRGERIYAVRFIGDRGYVVTFRQTDPLYTLDLADPARPRVTGELKILGYSAYLHPVGEHELLGVGQDATPEGMRLGTQVSLFDVSDPAAPRLLQHAPPRRVDVLGRRVRPPRVPVVGAQAPRGRAGLRRERQRRAGDRLPGRPQRRHRRGREDRRARRRAADARRRRAPLHAHGRGAARVRPRHARSGAVHGLRVRLTARIAAGARCSRHDPPSQTSSCAGRGLRRARALRRPLDGHRRRIRRRRG